MRRRCGARASLVVCGLQSVWTQELLRGVWDLSSSTRDQIRVSSNPIGRRILNPWTTREVPKTTDIMNWYEVYDSKNYYNFSSLKSHKLIQGELCYR